MSKEISFTEAIELIRSYAGKSDYRSLHGCLATKDPMLSIALLPKIIPHEKAIPPALMRYAMVLAPKSAYVRRNLIKPLRACGEFEQVRALEGFAQDKLSFHLAEQQYLLAHAQHRAADVVRACETLYVETGDITYLQEAAEEARDNLGWRRAWGYYFRLTLIDNSNYALHLFSLLHLLDREDAREEFKQVTSAARQLGGFDGPLIYAAARIAMWRYALVLLASRTLTVSSSPSNSSSANVKTAFGSSAAAIFFTSRVRSAEFSISVNSRSSASVPSVVRAFATSAV
ncbi:hypothetical protein [Spiribacter curvatus]|uniref:hypothetical protein n=1 Tax=Spiribacter curvatus TaxID=1335757 RepID=UPI0011D1986D|nr:hypothetical protein [Spiribacter curvatus]